MVWQARIRCGGVLAAILFLFPPLTAAAQPAVSDADAEMVTYDGPAAPVPPDVFAKDDEGRITLRATRLSRPPAHWTKRPTGKCSRSRS